MVHELDINLVVGNYFLEIILQTFFPSILAKRKLMAKPSGSFALLCRDVVFELSLLPDGQSKNLSSVT